MDNNSDNFPATSSAIEKNLKVARLALKVALVAGALAAALAVIAVFGMRFLAPTEQRYRNSIEFTFEGSQVGRYPSGQPFNNTDVVSSQVLLNVHSKLNLAQYGIDESEFLSSVSIRPASPIEDRIIAGFQVRLENRGLTLTERKSIEDEMAARLAEVSRRRVLIVYTTSSIRAVPREVGVQIVAAIPEEWARNAIGEQRAFKVLGAPSAKIMEQEFERAGGDSAMSLALQLRSLTRLQQAIDEIRNSDKYVASIVDPQTGADVEDAAAKLGFLRAILLPAALREVATGITPDSQERYRRVFTDSIDNIRADLAIVNEQITTIRGLIDKFDRERDMSAVVGTSGNLTADVIVQPGGGADGGLSQLLNMRLEDQRFTLVRSLTEDLLPLERRKAAISGAIRDHENYLKFLSAPPAEGTPAPTAASTGTTISKDLVETAASVGRIVEVTNRELVLKAGNLFSSIALANPVTTISSWFAPANIALAIAFVAIVAAGVFLVAFAAIRQFGR